MSYEQEIINKIKNDKYFSNMLPKEFIDNKAVNLAFVEKDGSALEYLTDKMKDDEEVVMAAIYSGYKNTLSHASRRLRNDEGIVKHAMGVNPDAYEFSSIDLQTNPSIKFHYEINCFKYGFKHLKNIISFETSEKVRIRCIEQFGETFEINHYHSGDFIKKLLQ